MCVCVCVCVCVRAPMYHTQSQFSSLPSSPSSPSPLPFHTHTHIQTPTPYHAPPNNPTCRHLAWEIGAGKGRDIDQALLADRTPPGKHIHLGLQPTLPRCAARHVHTVRMQYTPTPHALNTRQTQSILALHPNPSRQLCAMSPLRLSRSYAIHTCESSAGLGIEATCPSPRPRPNSLPSRR